MAPPAKRKQKNEHLADYPGLHQKQDGRYFIVHPITRREASLKTRDFNKAKKIYLHVSQTWAPDISATLADKVIERLEDMAVPQSMGRDITLADYMQHWREEVLGYRIDDHGRAHTQQTKVCVTIKRNQGEPISNRTQRDYGTQCVQMEKSGNAQFSMNARNILTQVRVLLAGWQESPTHYNHLRAVLSRIFGHAAIAGIIERNPVRDIDKLPVAKREVLIPDEHYIQITDKLLVHDYNKRQFDGEWRVKVCDLIYMLSQQPVDIFALTEENLKLTSGEFGEIHLQRRKTGIAGVIEMDAGMRELIDWLLEFKRSQLRGVSTVLAFANPKALMIYPKYYDNRYRWKQVTHRAFQKYWAEACTAAGYKGAYRLTDLRKKGLTDEFINQGKNDKGIHNTEAMQMHYVLLTPPKRSRNTLINIRSKNG